MTHLGEMSIPEVKDWLIHNLTPQSLLHHEIKSFLPGAYFIGQDLPVTFFTALLKDRYPTCFEELHDPVNNIHLYMAKLASHYQTNPTIGQYDDILAILIELILHSDSINDIHPECWPFLEQIIHDQDLIIYWLEKTQISLQIIFERSCDSLYDQDKYAVLIYLIQHGVKLSWYNVRRNFFWKCYMSRDEDILCLQHMLLDDASYHRDGWWLNNSHCKQLLHRDVGLTTEYGNPTEHCMGRAYARKYVPFDRSMVQHNNVTGYTILEVMLEYDLVCVYRHVSKHLSVAITFPMVAAAIYHLGRTQNVDLVVGYLGFIKCVKHRVVLSRKQIECLKGLAEATPHCALINRLLNL